MAWTTAAIRPQDHPQPKPRTPHHMSTSIIPPSRPKATADEIRKHCEAAGLPITDKVTVVGYPGYYMKTMGDPRKNDRGIYDDAFFVFGPNSFAAFNGNTDPSVARDGVATLQPGRYRYKPGIHGLSKPKAQQYPAFVQASPVIVKRDGTENTPAGSQSDRLGFCLGGGRWTDAQWWPGDRFAINIHRGSNNGTSSLGCQTTPPAQWDAFHALVMLELERAGITEFDLIILPQ